MKPAILILFFLPLCALAQGSKQDYERANGWRKAMDNTMFRHRIYPLWSDDGEILTYTTQINAKEQETVRVICATGEKEVLETTPLKKRPRKRHSYNARNRVPAYKGAPLSPDKQLELIVKDHNLWFKGEDSPLTHDGSETNYYEGKKEIFWSPDSEYAVLIKTIPGDEREVTYVESSPKDQLQPKVHRYDYLKPGDRVPVSKPVLFRRSDRCIIPIDDALFSIPWAISYVRWAPDSQSFTFLYDQRGHQVLRMISVNRDGIARTVVEDKSATFIDRAFKTWFHWLDESNELIWMSERDGYNHLYLVDVPQGKIKRQITSGPWMVRAVQEVDAKNQMIYFYACGLRHGEDPYHEHYARTSFNGADFKLLTDIDATHEVTVSPHGKYFVARSTRADQKPATELRRRSDGHRIALLEESNIDALHAKSFPMPQ